MGRKSASKRAAQQAARQVNCNIPGSQEYTAKRTCNSNSISEGQGPIYISDNVSSGIKNAWDFLSPAYYDEGFSYNGAELLEQIGRIEETYDHPESGWAHVRNMKKTQHIHSIEHAYWWVRCESNGSSGYADELAVAGRKKAPTMFPTQPRNKTNDDDDDDDDDSETADMWGGDDIVWEEREHRCDFVMRLVERKISQSGWLQKKLLKTGDRPLVLVTDRQWWKSWGVAEKAKGQTISEKAQKDGTKNAYGYALMRAREMVRKGEIVVPSGW